MELKAVFYLSLIKHFKISPKFDKIQNTEHTINAKKYFKIYNISMTYIIPAIKQSLQPERIA